MAEIRDPEKPKLSEEEIADIAKEVAKCLKAKELRAIAGYILKSWNLLKSPFFWGILLFGIAAACITAYNSVPGVVKEKFKTVFDAEMTNQIKLQFAEPRISNIVVTVAGTEASKILSNEGAPATKEFHKELGQLREDLPKDIYANFVDEDIHLSDTNRAVIQKVETNQFRAFVKMNGVPITGSLQATMTGEFGELFKRSLKGSFAIYSNLFIINFTDLNTNITVFNLQ